MKKIVLLVTFVLLGLTSFYLISCQSAEKPSNSVKKESILLINDSRVSSEPIEVVRNGEEIAMAQDDLEKFYTFFNRKFGTDVNLLIELKLRSINADSYYLFFYLQEEKSLKSVPFAVELVKDGNRSNLTGFTIAVTNSCDGAPCSCCKFVFDEAGKVKGCTCDGAGANGDGCSSEKDQKCNHRISE